MHIIVLYYDKYKIMFLACTTYCIVFLLDCVTASTDCSTSPMPSWYVHVYFLMALDNE